ncbi:hypothetical protein F0L74_26090 [Chitinophaga agrisoli]|uniref:Uncharacterized protein n=1 Tax=Chitinophaga agrisoli TaxID=2607653 RepID=A0A5B2VL08_9BACT|nr:hypothetical protein [Chitinophaga agrisoli]KAA2239665.1 hypothetical protein F0L74_26090 [Chitinophaga agrisoli]
MSIPGTHNVLFNALKHHLGAIGHLIASCPVAELPQRLKVLGNSQMDLYLGRLSETDIARETILALAANGITSHTQYASWLQDHHGYRTIILSDHSAWILRAGKEEERYIHLHPGRYSPDSVRVKATVLKTAIALWIYLKHELITTIDLATLNRVRREVLDLSPIKELAESKHILQIIDILKSVNGQRD